MNIDGNEEIVFVALKNIEKMTEIVYEYSNFPCSDKPYTYCFCNGKNKEQAHLLNKCSFFCQCQNG